MIRNVILLCGVCFSLLFANFTHCNLPLSQYISDFHTNDINNAKNAESNADSATFSSTYMDLQYLSLNLFDVKSTFIHNFIFAPQDMQTLQTQQNAKKSPNIHFTNFHLLPLKSRHPSVKIRGFGKDKIGKQFSDIMLDSTRNRTLATFGVNEVSISQGYTLPLKGTTMEKIEITSAYTILSNNEHRIKAQIARDFRLWDFVFGYDFSNADLSANYSNRIDSSFKNHAIRAKFGLNYNANHKYSANVSYQKGEKSGLLQSYGTLENVWHTPNYDRISAYIFGISRLNPRISLKSKLYYNSFLNISKVERVFSAVDTGFYANAPHSKSTNNYSGGFLESLDFAINKQTNLQLGINLQYDNLKYTSTKWSKERELIANRNVLSNISTTIFAELMQKITHSVRFQINGSYDRNDVFDMMTNNITNNATTMQDWALQGIMYVDLSKAWLIYLNVMKNSQVPRLKDIYMGACGAKMINSYLTESTFIYGIGTCIKW